MRLLLAIALTGLTILSGAVLLTSAHEAEAPSASPQLRLPNSPLIVSGEAQNVLSFSVLGDSYAEGTGAGALGDGWVQLLSSDLCWQLVDNASEGGTGYANDGGAEGKSAFPTRVGDAVAGKPQLVIVEGGFNDDVLPPREVAEAADTTFMDLRTALGPGPAIIAIGPVASPKKPATVLRPISDAIGQAAKKNDVLYVDPIEENWLADPALFVSDGYHPNSSGHRQYASRLESHLKDIGAPGCK